ncbi:MAG: lectin-like protein [Pirellulaceae bacterium]
MLKSLVAVVEVLALPLLVAANSAYGGIIQWQVGDGGNGHYYEYVDQDLTWVAAKSAAESMFFMGIQGHLVTITSEAENNFVFQHVLPPADSALGAWIGLTDDEAFGGMESLGKSNPQVDGWRWLTGEPVSFTAWNAFSAEPNNGVPAASGDEDYGLLHSFLGQAVWNDQTSFHAPPFIVEFSAVPEPSSLLVCLGIAVCTWMCRNRQNPAQRAHSHQTSAPTGSGGNRGDRSLTMATS